MSDDLRSFQIRGSVLSAEPLAAGLYLVATPIGHLGDFTVRAMETLAGADVILCEDRRVTQKLMRHYGIKRPLVTYNDHSTDADRERVLAPLRDGGSAALVSDAGTPLVSDPGYRLVGDAVEAGIAVIPVPGASSVLAALGGAGLPTSRFFFAGFLPPKSVARKKAIGELASVAATLVLFESPRRLASALDDLSAILGADRPASVCRELTKLYETFNRSTLGELAAHYHARSDAGRTVKGEIVIVIGPPDPQANLADDDEIDRQLTGALVDMSVRDAADAVTAATGRPRRDVYARALVLKDRKAP